MRFFGCRGIFVPVFRRFLVCQFRSPTSNCGIRPLFLFFVQLKHLVNDIAFVAFKRMDGVLCSFSSDSPKASVPRKLGKVLAMGTCSLFIGIISRKECFLPTLSGTTQVREQVTPGFKHKHGKRVPLLLIHKAGHRKMKTRDAFVHVFLVNHFFLGVFTSV